MKKNILTCLIIMFILSPHIFSQQTVSPLSLLVKPGFSIPIGEDARIYKPGGGGTVTLAYDIFPFLTLGLNTGYSFLPIDTLPAFESRSLSIAHLGFQAGTGFEPIKKLSLDLYAGGGWYYGFTNEDTLQNANNPYVYGGLGFSYRLIPSFSIGLEGSYRNFLGLAQDVMVHLGGTLHIGGGKTGPSGVPPNRNIDLLDIQLSSVFPVFYGYYDENPLGVAVLTNKGNRPIENVKVTFYVRQYMDNPKECFVIDKLGVGEERQIPLYALFTDTVLDITEGTKVSANIIVESEIDDVSYANEYVESLRLYDRNAMIWDVTAKAASFVTAKDPDILRFSKNISGMVKGQVSPALNKNLVLAMALMQSLDLYGISYEIDPSSAYEDFARNAMMVDYLQFPRQTLDYKAGDCDDLSILYSALLESVGIETAFITIPGHIYMAFSTGMSYDEARRFFNNQDEIISIEDTTWVPVEVTALKEGFIRAWKLGAAEWQENQGKGQTELIPIRSAWSIYNAVGYASEQESDVMVPSADALLPEFLEEVNRFVETEIYSREEQIRTEIARTGGSPRSINKLGLLYARFGLTDRARTEFENILTNRTYLPAVMNLGMLSFLDEDFDKALGFFRRAESMTQDKPTVLLSLARVYHEQGNYEESARFFERLKLIEPRLAEQYAYLNLGGSDTSARASDVSGVRESAVWEEE